MASTSNRLSGQARAFWVTGPEQGEIRPESLGPPGRGEVMVETDFSAISRGTEALVYRGEVPESEWDRMRAPFQQGDFPAPVKYGYACVGRVIDGDAETLGQAVFCLHPHQDRFVVPSSAALPLPPGLPPERAVLAANMETALNALWDSRASAGDRIAVVGAGVVGALTAWLAGRMPGTEVTLIDRLPQRQALAAALGVAFALPEEAPGEQDLVVHASASEAGLNGALALAGTEARILELSWYGSQRPAVALGQAFHARRLQLISSQVGRLPVERRERWSHRRRLSKALELLIDPALDALFSGESAFDELPDRMRELSRPGSDALCHRLRYPPATH